MNTTGKMTASEKILAAMNETWKKAGSLVAANADEYFTVTTVKSRKIAVQVRDAYNSWKKAMEHLKGGANMQVFVSQFCFDLNDKVSKARSEKLRTGNSKDAQSIPEYNYFKYLYNVVAPKIDAENAAKVAFDKAYAAEEIKRTEALKKAEASGDKDVIAKAKDALATLPEEMKDWKDESVTRTSQKELRDELKAHVAQCIEKLVEEGLDVKKARAIIRPLFKSIVRACGKALVNNNGDDNMLGKVYKETLTTAVVEDEVTETVKK